MLFLPLKIFFPLKDFTAQIFQHINLIITYKLWLIGMLFGLGKARSDWTLAVHWTSGGLEKSQDDFLQERASGQYQVSFHKIIICKMKWLSTVKFLEVVLCVGFHREDKNIYNDLEHYNFLFWTYYYMIKMLNRFI